MANNDRDSRKKPEKNSENGGRVTPSDKDQKDEPKNITEVDTTQTYTPVSESKQEVGFTSSDIPSFTKALYYLILRALRYLFHLIWPKMPKPIEKNLPILVALAVVFITTGGYLVHRYWILFVDIPDICGTVYNDTNVCDTVPRDGKLQVFYTKPGDILEPTNFTIQYPQINKENRESIEVKGYDTLSIKLTPYNSLHQKKLLYNHYRRGNTQVQLTFFQDQLREHTLKAFQFNEKTLKGDKPTFNLELIGKNIPAFYGTVFNASDEDDVLPVIGQYNIYENLYSEKSIHKGYFKIVSQSLESGEKSIPMEPWQECNIKVEIQDQNKELFGIYRIGKAALKLTFFPNNNERKSGSKRRIEFNKKTLETKEPLFVFNLFGEQLTDWTSKENQICFLLPVDEIDPNCRWSLENAKRILEDTATTNQWFRVTDTGNFNEYKDKFTKSKEKSVGSSAGQDHRGHPRALPYQGWLTIVQVAINCVQVDSQMKWNFHVTDALDKIPENERKWSEKYQASLDFDKAKDILSIVRDIVIRNYSIRGRITNIEGKEVDLDIGSLMGVKNPMSLSVLPKRSGDEHIGTIKINHIRNGKTSRGSLTDAYSPIKRGYRVIYGGK